MNRRNETRFEVSAPATLTLVDNPNREMNCQLVDVSGAGMQLASDEPAIVDDMVSLEVGPHSVLAAVRYCTPRGGKFTIGVERLHVVFAITLAEHQNKAERIQALIENYQLRTASELAAAAARAQTELEATAAEQAAESVETDSGPVVPAKTDADTLRSAALETIQTRRFIRPRTISMVVGALMGTLTIALLMFASPMKPKRILPLVKAAAKQETETVQPQAVTQPAPEAVVETSKSTSTSTAGKRRLSVKLNGTSWVSACADGRRTFERILTSGDTREVEFSDRAVVRVGSAGAVEIALDGKPVGPLGQPAQLRLLEFSAVGMRPLPMRDPADDCAPGGVN